MGKKSKLNLKKGHETFHKHNSPDIAEKWVIEFS
jgi:hypothetical protein